MDDISTTTIGTLRNAPAESAAIRLYNYNGAEDVTLAQLVMALAVRTSALYERNSVAQLNLMNRGVDKIEKLSAYAEKVLAGDTAGWADIRKALIDGFGIAATALPETIATYDDRMRAMTQIRQRLTTENSSVDRIAIEIETAISRRDNQYRLATETVVHFGKSSMNTAVQMAVARGRK